MKGRRITGKSLRTAGVAPDADPHAWPICKNCPLPPPTICAPATLFRFVRCPSNRSSAFTPVREPPGNERYSATRRRIWTTGSVSLPAATRWPGLPRLTGYRSRLAMACGRQVWGFSSALRRSGPWPCRSVRAISTCRSSFSSISSQPCSVQPPPWLC